MRAGRRALGRAALVVVLVLVGLPFSPLVGPVSAVSRDAGSDLALAAGNQDPAGIWSDGITMWVTDDADRRLYAYDMASKAPDADKDFTALDAGNVVAAGIWSDGTTMWVAERGLAKLYAYRMSDGGRDAAKDFDTLRAAGNFAPRGIWSDGTTMWVADTYNDKLYAYSMVTKARDAGKDFDTLDAANTSPQGIWSDGRSTMWVADASSDKLYAYDMADKARDAAKDLDTLDAANTSPQGIWSDGITMWVADASAEKIYAYDMPAGVSAALRTPSRLVANTDQTHGRMVGIHSSNPKIGQGFTTGAWANGYVLTWVAVRFDAIGADAALTTEMSATINEPDVTDESKPGDALCTLVGPPSYAPASRSTYTAPAGGCRLSPSTAYFVVLEREYEDVVGAASLVSLGSTVAATESSRGAAGWSIADYHNYWTHDMWRQEAERIVKIALAGYPVPNTAATNEDTVPDTASDTVPEAETADAEPLWSTTLTVGTRSGYGGYSVFGKFGLGALPDTKFEVDGTYFHVGYVALLDGDLIFGLAKVLHSGFVLRIGDQEFASGDAVLSRVGVAYRFHWEDAGLVWSDDDEVLVSLFLGRSAPASVPNPLNGFTVVNAENQRDVESVVDGATLTLAGSDDSSYSIRVDTNAWSGFIGSVRLELSGAKSAQRTAESGPYSLHGGGKTLIGEGLPVGSYTLRATAYSQQDLGGQVLGTLETSFAVEAGEPLTASVENAATTHGGSAAFTLELRFSEETALSFKTLRDHSFVVTGGDVVKAQRMDRPSNIRWRITVRPHSDGDVTIVLPVTTNCGAQGAICTRDGRKLSSRLELTVNGPD